MLPTTVPPISTAPASPAERHPAVRTTRGPRRVPARLATAAVSTTAFLAVLLVGGSSAALAAGARFVPEDTSANWDGAAVTVSFREVDVELEGDVTTISVRVTVDLDAVCTLGESTLAIHRSVTGLDVADHPVGDDGTVAGTATVPLEVKGLKAPGRSCTTRRMSVTATLEDFWTGATLVHTTRPASGG